MRAAAAAIERLVRGRALPEALDDVDRRFALPHASRPALRDIAYGTVRRLGTARALAQRLNAREPAPAVAAVQWVALSELLGPQRRHEAVVVDQVVGDARGAPDLAPAAGFLNATLRRFLREREALVAAVGDDPEARWNHPAWWVEQLRRDHPRDWEAVLAADDTPAPMTLRVDRKRHTAAGYLEHLQAQGLSGRVVGPDAIVLDEPAEVAGLPGYAQGWFAVQDLAAQMAAPLLAPRDGERVLDACAAPGGKSVHLLEVARCELTALDIDPGRLDRVRENLDRAKRTARVLAGDAADPRGWWDGRPFQRILLDAPCSASGIVRRHPDVRWLRRRRDLATLANRQSEMLGALWGLLEPGGTLLYATCSVFRDEGERVVERFCANRPDARRQMLTWRWEGDSQDHRIGHLLPRSTPARDHDGFFYASIQKRP